MKGKIFVIAGPSGVGKDTIMEILIKKVPQLVRAISCTDRPKRTDDKSDSYHFVSKKEFNHLIKTNEIFEWEYARDKKNRYGSSRKEVLDSFQKGQSLIKIVGPKSFKKNFKQVFADQAIGIFIKYEDLGFLKNRIKQNRPDINPRELEIRYKQAFKDMAYAKDYDYLIVNPEGHPEKAVSQIKKIIEKIIKGER